ncbi:peptidoglycan-binding protein LysM [Lysobacter sp. A3-1-A15]|uniref:peptidoglycan-binding protein LysM n=1 Tax=Novilysobacter viscosus TaxID=3098602 RepID=UPI002EDADBD1
MGMFDFIKDAGARIFGRDHDRSATDSTKPLSTHLREHGIDPDGIRFRFEGDTVVMEGTVRDQDTREKAVLIVGNVEGVGRVDDRLSIGAPGSNVGYAGGSAGQSHASAGSPGGEWTSKTYTVESGDTLSGISKKVYGDAGQYNRIFEANKPMLSDPDKIYPGQVLRIPPQA